MTIDVVYEDPRWQEAGLDDLAEAAEHATLAFLGLDPDLCEVAVLACDDARIAELNAEFREKPTPTNVLSWPSEERATPGVRPDVPEPDMPGMEIELGDIAIAYETCTAEAKAGGTPFNDHVTHLLVHGLLHLLGYDHITDEDAAIMEGIETEILATMGIKDPY